MAALYINKNKGSLMLEMCLTLALFSIVISFSSLTLSGMNSLANKAQTFRTSIYNNKQALDTFTGSSTENLSIKYVTPCRKLLTASSTLSTLLTLTIDTAYNKDTGYDCGGIEPQRSWHINSPTSSFSLNSNTLSSLDVSHGILYAAGSSTDAVPSNFFIVHNSSISNIDTKASIHTIDVANTEAYIAAQGPANQFQVINIRNAENPTLLVQKSLPGVSGSYPNATSIFYYKSKVYIGTHRTAGNEFHIYDVSHPENPVWLGSIELNHNINDITVKDAYAYLATSGNSKDIIILDISVPSKIKEINSVSFLGNEDTVCVFLMGTTLYIGRNKTTVQTYTELVLLDIQDYSHPFIISALHTGASVVSLRAAGNYVFAGLSGTKPGIYSIDIHDPSQIQLPSSPSYPLSVVALDYEDEKISAITSSGTIQHYENH